MQNIHASSSEASFEVQSRAFEFQTSYTDHSRNALGLSSTPFLSSEYFYHSQSTHLLGPCVWGLEIFCAVLNISMHIQTFHPLISIFFLYTVRDKSLGYTAILKMFTTFALNYKYGINISYIKISTAILFNI